MQPNQELINALRSVGNEIALPYTEWDFSFQDRCNCGLLAQELGVKVQDIDDSISGHWSGTLKKMQRDSSIDNCFQTGLPLNEVFQVLADYGLTAEDIEEIEMVGRSYFRLGSHGFSSDPIYGSRSEYQEAVANYFFRKADELQQQLNTLQLSHKESKEQSVGVK